MQVSGSSPFQIVYSLYEHECLGYLFGSYVVQLDSRNRLTFRYQSVSPRNISEFEHGLRETDLQLIELTNEVRPKAVAERFGSGRHTTTQKFFRDIYQNKGGDKLLQAQINQFVQPRKAEILSLLRNKLIFESTSDGTPTGKRIYFEEKPATVYFNFFQNEENTHYLPGIMHDGQKLTLYRNNALILAESPAWLLINHRLYHFSHFIEGIKLRPFLEKKFILISKDVEKHYYEKFVTSLIRDYVVRSKGFGIIQQAPRPEPQLRFKVMSQDEDLADAYIRFSLYFNYGKHSVSIRKKDKYFVQFEERGERDYVFYKVKRDLNKEEQIINLLKDSGLHLKNGIVQMKSDEAVSWMQTHDELLRKHRIKSRQEPSEGVSYFVGKRRFDLEFKENKDWFDIRATVCFGDYEISFLELRKHILSGQRTFYLPNGEKAFIPEEWFVHYEELFHFMTLRKEKATLKKHHLTLVKTLEEQRKAAVSMNKKLLQLRDFEKIQDYELPETFGGTLRSYQQAGYNWLRFLEENNFGGCLADDMGLGKTVQTLALLQSVKERGKTSRKKHKPSLLIMPTSLVYNWQEEARKFTPELKVLKYRGADRDKQIEHYFSDYDLILTSYGIARIDAEELKRFPFRYIILDESQAIKNPDSRTAKALKKFKADSRLVLTGTPVENTTLDLWSQMSFANPGLLGNRKFFGKSFQIPIEKKQDVEKKEKLASLIKPFLLRRTKMQVAQDLPEKVEQVKFCEMSDEQREKYEEVRAGYRKKILEEMETEGRGKSAIMILEGLTKLRQIANHPRMTDEDYQEGSGKSDEIMSALESALENGHKILVFSQFVKHLNLIREQLDRAGRTYAYLDGSTKDRQAEVERFQNDEDTRLFLLSIKAGGVGLNLTAADFVFILDPWWNPAVEAQAVDRAHRIGQQQTVFIYRFITRDTVEEKIKALQDEKKMLADELISTEESFMKKLSADDIRKLLE